MGLLLAAVLFAASVGLFYAHSFIHSQVVDQLSAQQITFPAKDSEALNALPSEDKTAVEQYAGQQLVNGAQAAVFANHYINAHLQKIGGGKTYSQLSAASMADPTNAALTGQVQTVFRGETLRGMLLNAYAFDTMATVAGIAAWISLAAGGVLLVLAGLGFVHADRATTSKKKSARRR